MSRKRLAVTIGAPVAAFAAGASLGLAGIVRGVSPCPFTFGASVIRAEVVCKKDQLVRDLRVDRGRITATAPGRILTLTERDGTVVDVQVSQTARITLAGAPVAYGALRRGMRVQTLREGDGPADTVDATRR